MSTVDLAALAKSAAEATPGPWQRIGTLVARGIGGIARVENDGTDYSTGEDLSPETVEAVELADAAYIAAASPDVVAALVRVALAAKALLAFEWTVRDVDALRAALADLGA